ncbi:MAG: DVU0259 family response regulator domain-containing protein [Thermodesulfobacteriota bacterium]
MGKKIIIVEDEPCVVKYLETLFNENGYEVVAARNGVNKETEMIQRRTSMSKKILVVDDDPNIVKYLETLFTDAGYQVVTAKDGHQAYEVFEAERPDLISLDLDMPEQWGPRFYRQLRKNPEYKDTPVIVVSGLSGIDHAVKDAAANIKKPFDRDELLKVVKETIG